MTLGDFMVERGGSVNPVKFPKEQFELYSIPAHDRDGFELARGAEIGSSKRIVHPGDILVSKIVPHIQRARIVGPIGDHRQIASTEWIAFRSDIHDPRFFRFFLLSRQFHRQFMNTVSGVGGSLNRAQPARVKPILIPVPPLDEQRRIVELLEDHLSRLDAAEAGLRQTHLRLRALERSALDACFGIGDGGVALSEVVEGISAGKSFGGADAPALDGEWGIVKVSSMTWGEFRPEENKAVTGDRVDPRFEIREGDLLVSRANTSEHVGASVLVGPVRPRLLLSDKSLRLQPRAEVNPEWLWRALQAPSARTQISGLATGTKESMRNISQRSLLKVRVPADDPEAQAEALRRFHRITSRVGPTRAALSFAQTRAKGLRNALLAAAFSGELSRPH